MINISKRIHNISNIHPVYVHIHRFGKAVKNNDYQYLKITKTQTNYSFKYRVYCL